MTEYYVRRPVYKSDNTPVSRPYEFRDTREELLAFLADLHSGEAYERDSRYATPRFLGHVSMGNVHLA